MATRGRRVHSIEKSIQLLDCFWQVRRPLSLSELERMTGWAKSTIHGLLASMLDSAVIEQNATDGKYRLGYHLFELGSAVSQGWNVPEICKPHLQSIVDQLRESAYLARLSGDELILVDCEEPHTNFRVASEAGTRLPLHCTSQGKIILANRPASEVGALLRRKELYAYTDATVTDAAGALAGASGIEARGLRRRTAGIPAGPAIRCRADLRQPRRLQLCHRRDLHGDGERGTLRADAHGGRGGGLCGVGGAGLAAPGKVSRTPTEKIKKSRPQDGIFSLFKR